MKTAQEKALEVLHVFRRMNPGIAHNHIEAFLQVACDEGVDTEGLQKRMEVPQGTVSRALKYLEGFLEQDPDNPAKMRQAGYSLIEKRYKSYEGKKQFIYLTKKGKEILVELEQVLK